MKVFLEYLFRKFYSSGIRSYLNAIYDVFSVFSVILANDLQIVPLEFILLRETIHKRRMFFHKKCCIIFHPGVSYQVTIKCRLLLAALARAAPAS